MPRLRFAYLSCLLAMVLCLLSGVRQAGAEEVVLPITLDYPFIRAAFIRSAFTAPGQRAVAVNKDQGCTLIELWDLQVQPDGERVKLKTRIKIRAGFTILGKCLDPVNWEGVLEAWQKAEVDAEAMRFRVVTQESRLLGDDGRPAVVGNLVLSLVETHVHAYLNQLNINLQPPVKDLGVQLPLFFRDDQRERVEAWLQSLKPVSVSVRPQAVKVLMSMQVELPPVPPAPEIPPSALEPAPITERQVEAFTKYWEAWDSYLVTQIMSLAGKELSAEERDQLLAAVLDARFGFVRALVQPGQEMSPEHDLVRQQFLETWQRLAPIMRKHLLPEPSASLFNYLAFFTAYDALAALDKLGPALGLEISRQGLVRLARLVDQAGFYPELDYAYEVDPKLRTILGFGPPLPVSGRRYDPRNLVPSDRFDLFSWLVSRAHAAENEESPGTGKMANVLEWAPPKGGEFKPYLDKVRDMLAQAARQAWERGKEKKPGPDYFVDLVWATAWQESCWRQFERKGGELVYLRSYNNTSVGVMQINERVWRGLYDISSLRWDAVYNGRAGCEILENYLRRYALAELKSEEALDWDLLARIVYAIYNGGPAQAKAYMKRHKNSRFWKSDRLFWQKYKLVKNGKLARVASCLGQGD